MTDSRHITETFTPADQAEAAATVRNAASNGTAVYSVEDGQNINNPPGRPLKKGTGPEPRRVNDAENGGCEVPVPLFQQPPRPGIGLSLAKLNRVIDYPADDLTITVEAGMIVGELNERLAKHLQRLPVDVPHPDRTTIGAAVAANHGGPRRYAYGTIRDYLLGFTAVDANGIVFAGGGRVVKNAAGYNMCRLMAGAYNSLGILTQVTLMVRPACETSAILACDLDDFELAEKLLAGLTRSEARPAAVELLAGRPREGNPVLGPRLEGSAARLYVGFEGAAAEVEWMTAMVRSEWLAAGVATPILASAPAVDQQWRWLAEMPTEATINVLPGEAIETVVELLRDDPERSIQSHAGNGVIRLCGGRPVMVSRKDGNDASSKLMRAIKERFDPQNILNPQITF